LRMLPVLGLLGAQAIPPTRSVVAKKVLSTPWWPPGTEKTLESIGILSRGVMFVTAEMAVNRTWRHEMKAELDDVADVLFAANATTEDLVECFVNVPAGQRQAVERAIIHSLNATFTPALTIVEMPGEFPGLPTSMACTAVQGGPDKSVKRKAVTAVKATPWGYNPGFAWLSGSAHTCSTGIQDLGAEIGDVVRELGGAGAEDLVDCLAFVDSLGDAGAVRKWYSKATLGALTVVQTNPGQTSFSSSWNTTSSAPTKPTSTSSCTLRCVAALNSSRALASGKRGRRIIVDEDFAVDDDAGKSDGGRKVQAVSVGGFVFVSGVHARNTNATDAIDKVKSTLVSASSRGNLTLNCMFFAKEQDSIQSIFVGFRKGFNADAPPPPSRGEYTAPSECSMCPSVVKCVAAMPLTTD